MVALRFPKPASLLRVWLLRLLTLCCLVPALAAAAESTAPKPLVFGFLPIVSSERLVTLFAPLVEYLSSRLQVPIRMETAPDFAEFVRRTQQERRYDLLFTAPHFYQIAHRKAGYRAIVKVDSPGMDAVIVTPVNSGIDTLDDLRGRRLAITDPLALATILVKHRLRQAALDPSRDLYLVATPSHNASLLSTYRGATDASALMRPLFLRAPQEITAGMQIIAATDRTPHMPISVAPWLDDALVMEIQQVLIAIDQTDQGRILLQRLEWPGFTAANQQEYDAPDWSDTDPLFAKP